MIEARPAIYTIPAGVSFVDALAHGLLADCGDDPLALSRATVLLPTRRACRSLREAFLRASEGRGLLLPRLWPLGDLDADEVRFAAEGAALGPEAVGDLPPAMPSLKRQLLLAQLILKWSRTRAEAQKGAGASAVPLEALREDQAIRLAAELARLLDQVETEGLDFSGLTDLVPEDYAVHWQATLKFLHIVTDQWPDVQREQGCIGAAERRRLLLEAQAEAWRQVPPEDLVVAAGSTGSIPATAALIAAVAELPRGMVILPGLDRSCAPETWLAVRHDPTHPQHGLALLLDRLGVEPKDVADWPDTGLTDRNRDCAWLVNTALRPAEATDDWRDLEEGPGSSGAGTPRREVLRDVLSGLHRVDCASPEEEALVIALLMRQALTVDARTAALVTPDRDLARRVAAELRRWAIDIDDSAGVPLGDTAPGSFLRLTAEMIAEQLAPLPLLAALKHPLAADGLSEGGFRAKVRALEIAVLRGPRPAPGFDGLRQALAASGPAQSDLANWLEDLAGLAEPFTEALNDPNSDLAEIVRAHIGFAEGLADSDERSGAERLWDHDAGEAAADFVADLCAAAPEGPPLKGERYPALLASLLAGIAVRPRYGRHPRLSILGPLEARLQRADVVILGGLNEGTWPAETNPGPWLSRPMRKDFGLPSVERRIGLGAHDFTQAFAAPRVYMTRAKRVEGTPTVPSRWLLRLDALLRALHLERSLEGEAVQWQAWAQALDRPERQEPVWPPMPRPPVAARPRRLSVTQIETWMRDPYALYAAKVLELRALDPLDADPGAAERGTLIHEVLERYLSAHPQRGPADPLAVLLALGKQVFAQGLARPGLVAFWWPRFERIAGWFVAADTERRAKSRRAWAEAKGEIEIPGPAGVFKIHASADRIDLLTDGRIAILDYKTGAIPAPKDIALGFSPQLPLEAAIAARGGFAGVQPGELAGLEFWRLTGGEPPGEIRPIRASADTLAAEALDGLRQLVAAFDDPETPYQACPRPDWSPRFSDYTHLARIKEWAAGSGTEESS